MGYINLILGFVYKKKKFIYIYFFCISKYIKCLIIFYNVCYFIIIKGLLLKILLLLIAKYFF